jgi:hypothetical protein
MGGADGGPDAAGGASMGSACSITALWSDIALRR